MSGILISLSKAL